MQLQGVDDVERPETTTYERTRHVVDPLGNPPDDLAISSTIVGATASAA